jgi:D-3-phosphoglycerate dehydrogenase / 2-oxoglutarate reductase
MTKALPRVLIADKLSPQAIEVFKQRGVEADVKVGMTPEELLACIGEYDGLAVRSATKATAAVFKSCYQLKVVGRAGIGVDNVDIPAATAAGIVGNEHPVW